MLSRRVPPAAVPNAWTRRLEARRVAGAPLFDLTDANPTRTGLTDTGADPPPAPRDPAEGRYEPDPRGLPSARAAVAAYYAARGHPIAPSQVVLVSGTSEAYAHLFRLLADPGDAVLAPRPSYPLFEPLAALEGVRLEPYRLAWDGAWHLDRDSFERTLELRPRAAIVVEPNHPTGTCLSTDDRAFLVERCAREGVALISDEVFGDFPWAATAPAASPGGGDPASLPSLIGETRLPVFVLSGLSKVCGLPQLKLSWIVAGGPAAARDRALEGLEWIADLFLSVATPVQRALPALLEGRHGFQARARERIAANLERLDATIAARPELDRLPAAGGWVAIVRLPSRRQEEEWALELLERDVIVHPGHFYDLEGGPFIVVSLIVEPAVLDQGLARLEALLAES